MSQMPPDIAALLNDDTPGTGAPAQPSAEMLAQRAQRISVERVEQLQAETLAELESEPDPEPEPVPTPVRRVELEGDERFAAWTAEREAR